MGHTQGWTVRLSSDLHGFYNWQVHTVFDSGAAANFRLTEFPTTKRFETRLSVASPAAVTGTDRAPTITSVVSTPRAAVAIGLCVELNITERGMSSIDSWSKGAVSVRIEANNPASYGVRDIQDPPLGLLSKPSSYNQSRGKQDEEGCPLLAQSASQAVTPAPADTSNDSTIWTTVVNTRKEKRRRKITKDPQDGNVRNTKPTTGPEQLPFTDSNEDWVETHSRPREWQSKKSRKSSYHPRNRLGLPLNKQDYPPKNKPNCGPKYHSKQWDVDIIVLRCLNTNYSQRPSPAVSYKKKLNPSTIPPPQTQSPRAIDDTQPQTLPPAIAKHSAKVLTSSQARLLLKAAQARNQDLRNQAETLGIRLDQNKGEKDQESQKQAKSTLHSDNELMTVQRELRDQRASITNQGNMINELAKSVDSSNTSVKNLSETVRAFFATFHRQESRQEHTSSRPCDPVTPPSRTTSSNDTSTNTKEPRYSSQQSFSTKFRSLISKEPKGIASLESQSGQLISPDGTHTNIDSLPDTVSVLIPESSPGHTTFDMAYAESQRRAMNPLLPTPNFDWYDNFGEEARPPPPPPYLGRPARWLARARWAAQGIHQPVPYAPHTQRPREFPSLRLPPKSQGQNDPHSDYRPRTDQQQRAPAYSARWYWH